MNPGSGVAAGAERMVGMIVGVGAGCVALGAGGAVPVIAVAKAGGMVVVTLVVGARRGDSAVG